MLRMAAEKKLLHGKTVGVDTTPLEANAAMKTSAATPARTGRNT